MIQANRILIPVLPRPVRVGQVIVDHPQSIIEFSDPLSALLDSERWHYHLMSLSPDEHDEKLRAILDAADDERGL